jgi:hypothetical protein
MDAAAIQAKLYYGYGAAAARIGFPFKQFRAASGVTTLASPQIATLRASMTVASSGFNFGRPAKDDDHLFNCLVDGRATAVGDILQDASGVSYVIGAMAPLLPILAIRCNAVVKLDRRAAVTLTPGLNPYQAPTLASQADLATSIPACISLESTGRNTHGAGLPSDAPGPLKYQLLLSPQAEAFDVAANDYLYDDAGRRFMVAGTEKTPIALRLDVVHLIA